MSIGQTAGSVNMHKIGVYILRCKNGRYYIGSTNDINRRLKEHKNSKAKSTKHLLPINPVFFQGCSTLNEARKLELVLKRKKSRIIIDRIIEDGFIK